VVITTVGFATSGQRKVTKQTTSKALTPRSAHDLLSSRRIKLNSKHAFPFRRIGLDEPSPMRIRTIALLSLVVLFGLELSGREPIKSPPPVKQSADIKVVRARYLGVPFDGTPGKLNSITDIPGVEVGYTTLISGEGKLEVGMGPVRTGVTAIIPRGHGSLNDPVYAGYFSLNGNGEMTGTAWVDESGFLEGPIVITNTHSVGVARDAVIAWRIKHGAADTTGYWWSLPVVAETWDGWLNDINGFHVKPEHVFHALDTAHGGAIEEGSVGGGTGMICYEFKGGNGTASRQIDISTSKDVPPRTFVVGVFLQANFGRRSQLVIAGVPVGKEIPGEVYKSTSADPSFGGQESGSCIAVVATDAPLLPNQLKRLARRVSLGLARTGTVSGNGSGDLFIAFSTANPNVANPDQVTHTVQTIPNDLMDPLFTGVVQATEEAVVNALVDNQAMTGRDNHNVEALPHDRLRELIKRSR
jgi:D-aminopeptidase